MVLSHNGVYARFAADRIDQTDHLHSEKLDDFRFPVAMVVGRVICVAVFRFEREFIHSTDERMRNEKIFILWTGNHHITATAPTPLSPC